VSINGPGRLGGSLPRGSHRSGLAQLRHPARHVVVPALSWFRHLDSDMMMRSDALAWFQASSPQRGVPFSPRGPGGPVPPLRRYYGTLRLPSAPLAALRCLRLAIPPPRRIFAPGDRRRAVEGIGELMFRTPEPELSVETDGSPRFPETPRVLWPCSPTPARPSTPGPFGVSAWSPLLTRARTPAMIFRGSIARPGHSLSTLRSEGRPSPRKTRFRLPARLCRAGFVHPQGSDERFPSFESLPPFLSFPGAMSIQFFRPVTPTPSSQPSR